MPGPYTLSVTVRELGNPTNHQTASAAVTLLGADLAAVTVYPNPWRADNPASGITFSGLPANATIKIFDLSGRHVRTLRASTGSETWNLKSDSGTPAASGVYLYTIEAPGSSRIRGKFAVIR